MSHELLVDKLAEARAEIERLRALSVNNAHSWDAIVREGDELRAEIERLRALLREARHSMMRATTKMARHRRCQLRS